MGSKLNKNSDRALKRARTEDKLLKNRTTAPETFPKFLVMHSDNEDKPLAKLSPFLVAKTLETVVGKNFKTKKLFSGDLLVEVHTAEQSTALLALNEIQDYAISVTIHRSLNSTQGVISEDDLLGSPNEEILEGLKNQGVIAVRRITLRRDGQERDTKHRVLTFNSTSVPSVVKAGYLNRKVRPYIPNPRRCFRCQRFGHGSTTCRGKTTCAKCASNDHPTDNCSSDSHTCVNCRGPHPAYSRSCPKFKQEKEIITLKTKENLAYQEARKRLSFLQGGTYAGAAARGAAPPKTSVGTQYSAQDIVAPFSPPFLTRPRVDNTPLQTPMTQTADTSVRLGGLSQPRQRAEEAPRGSPSSSSHHPGSAARTSATPNAKVQEKVKSNKSPSFGRTQKVLFNLPVLHEKQPSTPQSNALDASECNRGASCSHHEHPAVQGGMAESCTDFADQATPMEVDKQPKKKQSPRITGPP
ncbi:unnamed protein product [Ixodes pacificus]